MDNIIVLKCGGSSMNELSDRFFSNILTLKNKGMKPIIVHGGGPAIQERLDQLQIESEFVNGLRKTTGPMIDVVEMVLTGTVNNALLRRLNAAGLKAIGLSGSDANLLTAEAKDFECYGYVGEVTGVNVSLLHTLLSEGMVPVIAPIAVGTDGTRYNVNADTVAGVIAKEIGATQLIFVTDVPGILQNEQLLEVVTDKEIEQLIASGTIFGGMLPKVQAAVNSLNEQLQEAMIVDGTQSELTVNDKLVGTTIKKSTAGVMK